MSDFWIVVGFTIISLVPGIAMFLSNKKESD